jgi:membrane-associated protein
MENIINFIFSHSLHAHWIVFFALILAGFNLPISEDLMIIISGMLAANVIPEHTLHLFICVFLGCYISDSIVYFLGRTLGRKILNLKWFKKTLPKPKLDQIHNFYKKYGFYTLIIGRFIPFGVRNCLFFTAGMSRMKYVKFLISDGIACIISNSTLFYISYTLGKNYQTFIVYLKKVNVLIFCAFIVTLITLFWYYKKKKRIKLQKLNSQKDEENSEVQ